MDFSDAIVNGIPLILLIVGLVQFAKNLGLRGNNLRILSAALGLALGVAYQLSKRFPTDFGGWLAVIVYGLALGVTASGLVDTARDIVQRVGNGRINHNTRI